ncbi:TetR/AcrR family transcriptional regulator [Actinocorallia sp. API 0066]|uniref:TetR/AcrR family transcriptional regulator n=1 Tax=Actinocorallia sp. API 0066 TaxID=2896846 RepID=UPI001E3A1383|nr:TetR/AcrR family transcriptional regulator [Actinocorallia sp. API 0066]MCD0449305.1 TetR/AcrR family transcriptional regulator [Actinocorallia sp. API 0066]
MFTELVKRALTEHSAAGVEPDEQTERILDAALAQFTDFGLRRSSMEDVARRSGLARSTVYRRFTGKDVLLEAVLHREVQRFYRGLTAVRESETTRAGQVVESGAFCLLFLRGHGLLRRLVDTEPESILPQLTVHSDALVELARSILSLMLRHELYGAQSPPAEVASRIEGLAEVTVRLTLSFVLNDRGVIPLETEDDARELSRRYVLPLYTALFQEISA